MPTLQERARQRVRRPENIGREEWAKMVEESRKRGCQLLRFSGLIVEIRNYSSEDLHDG